MPSPTKGNFYRRADGAWVKMKGHYKKVGADKYMKLAHYARRDIPKDRTMKARKDPAKRKRYPQQYD